MVNMKPLKNLWVAASDGDMQRVQDLIENEGLTPNTADDNHYTPMHAAASYAHLELLDYLLSKGGNINITDDDGETPLFTVESIETARYLVSKGADVSWRNTEGITAAESLMEDFPEVAVFLISLDPQQSASLRVAEASDEPMDGVADDLLERARAVMSAAEADGSDPDERLREIVSEAVHNGLLGSPSAQAQQETSAKRTRTE